MQMRLKVTRRCGRGAEVHRCSLVQNQQEVELVEDRRTRLVDAADYRQAVVAQLVQTLDDAQGCGERSDELELKRFLMREVGARAIHPCRFAPRIATLASPLGESKPEVGSSNNRTEGLDNSPRAMLSLRLCPPDTPLTSALPTMVFFTLVSLRACGERSEPCIRVV